MVQRSMKWGLSVAAAVLFAGSAQAMEFQFTDSVVDLRFDEYGAIGGNFVGDTQLLGATDLPSTVTNVDMVHAGVVYLPQFNTVLGGSSLNGRSGVPNPALTNLIAPNTLRSEYTLSNEGLPDLGVQVTTSLTSPGMVHQTYKFIYFNHLNGEPGGDNDVFVRGLPLLITYMLDPDIGTWDDDDSGSVAAGTARHWDEDFGNPGSASPSNFNDPMIEMLSFLNGAPPDELGTEDSGAWGMLNDLDNPAPLTTIDVDGPADDDDGAYGARWGEVFLGPLGEPVVLEIDIQFGGTHGPHDQPIPEPVTATLSMMALGALAWRITRRREHDSL